MQARNETMSVDSDEAQRGPAEPTTRERTPRFKLIKLEERIAPGGGLQGGNTKYCNITQPTTGTTC
jgi:hypothetical protein